MRSVYQLWATPRLSLAAFKSEFVLMAVALALATVLVARTKLPLIGGELKPGPVHGVEVNSNWR